MNAEQRIATNFEREIDAALKMLGDVQPPAGLASRIHHSLETAAVSSKKQARWPLWVPAAGVAMAALLLAVFLQTRSARPKQAATVQVAELRGINSASAQFPSPSVIQAENSHQQNEAKPAIRRSFTARKRPTYRRVNNLMSYPLTRQEKLLLNFARHAKPEDLQDLNPEYQAQVEAQQKADFEAYLKPVSGSTTNSERTQRTQNSPE